MRQWIARTQHYTGWHTRANCCQGEQGNVAKSAGHWQCFPQAAQTKSLKRRATQQLTSHQPSTHFSNSLEPKADVINQYK